MRRQEALYDSGRRHRILMWEGALRALVCSPAVLAAQLDRLASLTGPGQRRPGDRPLQRTTEDPPGERFLDLRRPTGHR
ncbi:Scr1 family TA system antitoxin-like transcriptional regulator [Streptomyces cyaneofuscatus]|uniref:Scr1 family TA system antitoxin-like transcriptional regulator n=1 Tax=Streptomyces cyaneofuscatus TaxID=66883 RepID=UPI003CEF3E16